jgi:hypothetical protein
MKIQPPAIPDDKLFRLLLTTPRPKQPLKFRIGESRLYLQAISSAEIADIESKNTEYEADIISKCLLLSSGKKAFSSGLSIMNLLRASEFKQLNDEVFEILGRINPMIITCDYKAWMAKLESGAKHPSNYITCRALGGSVSFTLAPNKTIIHDHPEQYFNIPKKELLDGHWMAYLAARRIYLDDVFKESSDEESFINANKDTAAEALKATNETRRNKQ